MSILKDISDTHASCHILGGPQTVIDVLEERKKKSLVTATIKPRNVQGPGHYADNSVAAALCSHVLSALDSCVVLEFDIL
jgi:hypothetical protein